MTLTVVGIVLFFVIFEWWRSWTHICSTQQFCVNSSKWWISTTQLKLTTAKAARNDFRGRWKSVCLKSCMLCVFYVYFHCVFCVTDFILWRHRLLF